MLQRLDTGSDPRDSPEHYAGACKGESDDPFVPREHQAEHAFPEHLRPSRERCADALQLIRASRATKIEGATVMAKKELWP